MRVLVFGAGFLAAALGLWVLNLFRVLTPDVKLDQEELFGLVTFPYDDWAAVLTRFVDAEGRVDYAALHADPVTLERFVALLGVVGPNTYADLFRTDAERLAYYLNAYNALVLYDVLDHWPLRSPHDIKLRFFYTTRFLIDGRKANLYELENHVIREKFDEPRVHFALNCASIACPRLPREPFLPARLEEQLEHATVDFLSAERNVAVEDGALVLSELFDWYAEDFAPDPARWIHAHASDRVLPVGAPVRHRPWDWTLNGRP